MSRLEGQVQVYTGDGKGKTTAAAGLALRALGAGQRVYIAQFIKGTPSSEIKALTEHFPEVRAECFGLGRFIKGAPSNEDTAAARRGIEAILSVMHDGSADVIIADELNGAHSAGLVSTGDILALVDARPPHAELVITGRNAPHALIERAHLVTEMCKVKHYFDDGLGAREGIEY